MKITKIHLILALPLFLSACGASLRPSAENTASTPALTGNWTEPVPGIPSLRQGFSLRENGRATSINMATLQYESWKQNGDSLTLCGKSIGNRQTLDFCRTYTVKEITAEKMVLQADRQTYTFRREQ